MPLNWRVFKILIQLDNENDALVLLAARKLVDELKSNGSDLRTLAQALETEWARQNNQPPPREEPPPWGARPEPPPWQPPPADPPRGGRMTDEEYDEFVAILEEIDGKDMSGKSRDFVADMTARHEQYGRRTFVSGKQWDWLRNLRDD